MDKVNYLEVMKDLTVRDYKLQQMIDQVSKMAGKKTQSTPVVIPPQSGGSNTTEESSGILFSIFILIFLGIGLYLLWKKWYDKKNNQTN